MENLPKTEVVLIRSGLDRVYGSGVQFLGFMFEIPSLCLAFWANLVSVFR